VYLPIGCDYFHVSQISELAFSDLFEWPKSLFYGVIFGRISLMAERIRSFIRDPQQTLKPTSRRLFSANFPFSASAFLVNACAASEIL